MKDSLVRALTLDRQQCIETLARDRRAGLIVEAEDGCWLWAGRRNRQGYGISAIPGERRALAHRLVYTAEIGIIPEGLTIDHLCRVLACVNPAHLEVVSQGENNRRSNHPTYIAWRADMCVAGLHPLAGENLIAANLKRGIRSCRECHNARRRALRRAVAA